MKIVIFTCKTGGGHNACANYIKEEFKNYDVTCDVVDYFDLVGKKASDIAEKIYLDSTKGNGKVFGSVYKLGELYSKTTLPSPIYGLNKLVKDKLYRFLKDNQYDFAIGTHLFPCLGLTAVKKEHPIRFINIATDYECIPFWKETDPDYFVIPSPLLTQRFIENGFSKDTILPFGISISSRFLDQKVSSDIPRDKDIILLTSGSMGFGNLKKVVKQMLEEIPNTYIVVICGNNHKMYNELSEIDSDLLIVKGFIHNMSEYMKASTIVISKPGGVTTTEVAELRKPLILMMPIPGVEDYNMKFFLDNQMCLKADNVQELIFQTKKLLANKILQDSISKNQEENIKSYSAKALVDFILNQIV